MFLMIHNFQPIFSSTSPSHGPFKISNKNREPIAELGSIGIFQPNIPPHHQARVWPKFSHTKYMGCPNPTPIWNFWPRPRPDHQARVCLKFPNKKGLHIASLGSISYLSQETSIYWTEHTSSYCPSKNPSSYPSAKPFQNSIPTNPLPHTQPTPHSNLLTSLIPFAPTLIHSTHGL